MYEKNTELERLRASLENELDDLMLKKAVHSYLERHIGEFERERLAAMEDPELQPTEEARRRYWQAIHARELEARRADQRKKRHMVLRRAGVIAASFMMISLTVFTVCLVSVDAVRDKVRDLVWSVYPDHSTIVQKPEEKTIVPKGWAGLYYPHEIPEGYYISNQQHNGGKSGHIYYENDQDEEIVFSQEPFTGGIFADNEDGEERKYDVPGYVLARIFEKDNYCKLLISDGEYLFTIKTPSYFSDEELIEIGKSIAWD